MSAWPATLPQNLFAGASEKEEESRLISAMDSGPASVRNRFTSAPIIVKTSIVLTGEQKQTFDTFFRTTLNHGTSTFEWKEPTNDATVNYRFKEKPEWNCIRPDPVPNNRLWNSVLTLEIIP